MAPDLRREGAARRPALDVELEVRIPLQVLRIRVHHRSRPVPHQRETPHHPVAAHADRAGQRVAAQLEGRVSVRILSTEGSLDETREAVEDALAEALDRLV